MSSVWLNHSREVAGSNIREVHLDLGWDRWGGATSCEAVLSAVGEIGIWNVSGDRWKELGC